MRQCINRIGWGVAACGLLVAGCAPAGPSPRVATQMAFANQMFEFSPPGKSGIASEQTHVVHGEGKVLEVEPVLGTVRVQTDAGERLGWWENRFTIAHDGGTQTYENRFPARVGDHIRFNAIEMNGDLYMTAVLVMPH